MKYPKVFLMVFSRPYYFILATLITIIIFTLAVWLPNIQLILVVANKAGLIETLKFVWSLYGSIESNFTLISASYTVAIAVLFGFNVALLTYYIKSVQGGASGLKSTGFSGVGGLVSGVFGIGCAACGTFILTPVLSFLGVGAVLAYLPLGGEEFGVLGVGLLLYSLYALIKKISEPRVCLV